MAFAATEDPKLCFKQGEITAIEAKAVGVNMVFAPVLDINNNPNKVIDKISLDMCVDKLRPVEKEIISLYYKDGYKEKEIANKLDVSINTVSSIKNRAIKKIRKNITQEFWV